MNMSNGQSRAEQSRAEQSRAEQSRAEQSRAEQSRAEQSRAEQSRAEQNVYLTPCTDIHNYTNSYTPVLLLTSHVASMVQDSTIGVT